MTDSAQVLAQSLHLSAIQVTMLAQPRYPLSCTTTVLGKCELLDLKQYFPILSKRRKKKAGLRLSGGELAS